MYENLSLIEAQRGRSIYRLGLLLCKQNEPEGEILITRAKELYKEITGLVCSGDKVDPFVDLIHPFYR